MSGGQAVVIENIVYYQGVTNTDIKSLCSIYRYNIQNQKWLSAIEHTMVKAFGVGQVAGKLITVGGSNKSSLIISNNMSFYNQHTGKWTNKSPMPTARQQPTVISQPTCLVVAGGLTSLTSATCYDCTNVVEIFCTITSQWSQANSLPIACSFQSGGVNNGMVHLIGGRDGTRRLQKTFVASLHKLMGKTTVTPSLHTQEASTNKSVWSEATDTPAYDSAAFVFLDVVLALGGAASADLTIKQRVRSIYAYSVSISTWIHVGELPVALSGACVVAISPVEFLVIGGARDPSTYADVYTKTIYKGTIATKVN